MKAHQRAKVKAIAETADYNPAEAEVAQRMLETTPEGQLDIIAANIKAEYGKGIESQFAIGRLLMEARGKFPADIEFGRWFDAQEFPFTRQTAYLLRTGAEREPEVRTLMAGRKSVSDRDKRLQDITVTTAVVYLYAQEREAKALPDPNAGQTEDVDQNYAALRNAYNRILVVVDGEPTGNAFIGMHVEDLAKSAGYIKALVEAYQQAKAAVKGAA